MIYTMLIIVMFSHYDYFERELNLEISIVLLIYVTFDILMICVNLFPLSFYSLKRFVSLFSLCWSMVKTNKQTVNKLTLKRFISETMVRDQALNM